MAPISEEEIIFIKLKANISEEVILRVLFNEYVSTSNTLIKHGIFKLVNNQILSVSYTPDYIANTVFLDDDNFMLTDPVTFAKGNVPAILQTEVLKFLSDYTSDSNYSIRRGIQIRITISDPCPGLDV